MEFTPARQKTETQLNTFLPFQNPCSTKEETRRGNHPLYLACFLSNQKKLKGKKRTNRYPGKSRRGDIHSLTRSFIQTLDRINGSHDRTATAIRRAAGQGG